MHRPEGLLEHLAATFGTFFAIADKPIISF